jgi:hypothetical protein
MSVRIPKAAEHNTISLSKANFLNFNKICVLLVADQLQIFFLSEMILQIFHFSTIGSN